MGVISLEKTEGTWIFCKEANRDMSVSFRNSAFTKNELVHAETRPQEKRLITGIDETQELWSWDINLNICVLWPHRTDTHSAHFSMVLSSFNNKETDIRSWDKQNG